MSWYTIEPPPGRRHLLFYLFVLQEITKANAADLPPPLTG
jgi:hypothetical protein